MKKLAAVLLAAFGIAAQANTISSPVNVGAGEVQYWQFGYSDLLPPSGQVATYTVGTTAIVTEDPMLCVFNGTVSAGNLVGCDDDSGTGYNASLTFNTSWPSLGSFVVALSGWHLSLAEALAGSNPGANAFASTLTVRSPSFFLLPNPAVFDLRQITHAQATGVPLPGTLLLLGAGLVGVGLMQRRRIA